MNSDSQISKLKDPKDTTRREFLIKTSQITASSALTAAIGSRIYAGEDNTIRIALVGCGGRGSGAAANAMGTNIGQV